MILKPGIRRFVGQTGANRHLATVSFWAPLKSSLALVRGVGSATFTRATTATCYGYQEADNAGASQTLLTIPAGIPRFSGARFIASSNTWSEVLADGTPIQDSQLLGYFCEGAATNYFLNSGAPATQTISLGVGTYTTSLLGTGSITSSAGTATATGYGAATSSTPNTIVVTVAGTVVFTVAGTVTNPQVENNAYQTSYIATAGTAVTRNADILTVQVAGNINLSVGSMYGEMSVVSLGNSFGALAAGVTVNIQFNRLQSSTIFNSYDGANNPTFNTGPFSKNTRYKTAISWGGANMYGTIGGAAVVSGPFKGSFTSDTSIAIGGTGTSSFGGYIRNVRIWQVQFPNATLQAITT